MKENMSETEVEELSPDKNNEERSEELQLHAYEPDYEEKINAIFWLMHKETEESRRINCHSCGYASCLEMAVAISKGESRIEDCVNYMADEDLKISMIDIRNGVPNYNAYLKFTDKLIANGKITEYSAIYFNIINFKRINQKYGFRKGDEALREYCVSVAKLAKAEELISVVSGNSYVGVVHKKRLDEVLKALESLPLLSLKTAPADKTVYVSARVAVYLPDGSDTSSQMIMEKLSATFEEISHAHNQNVCYYDEKVRLRKMREDFIIHAIKPAMESGEFEVHYQPKVDVNTRKMVGAEALIRWNHEGEMISPSEFIPICEKTGQVQNLDFYVLDVVCRDISKWLEDGIEVVTISVNFSKYHFAKDTVAEDIMAVVEKWGIPRQCLEIEFTETAYMEDSDDLISSIHKLHGYGLSVSMDDFGTGYSSLSMLQNMSFDTLKLDKSFLENAIGEPRARVVIGNIIRMAKELKMSVVSEGIETEKELEYMKLLNCDIAQGFLFDHPLSHHEFEERLKRPVYG